MLTTVRLYGADGKMHSTMWKDLFVYTRATVSRH